MRAALGRHGVLHIPAQAPEPPAQRDFAARFGPLEINVAGSHQIPGIPEIMALSNIVENGSSIGFADAGQGWHTDLSYSRTLALANVLHAVTVPRANGRPLGATEFANTHAATADLPADIRARVDGRTATHEFARFWDMMRTEKGSRRPPLTAAQRATKLPVSHPVLLVHPITGCKVLFADPGYTVRIDDIPPDESDALLDFLCAHQLQAKYRNVHHWSEGDVLIIDTIGTLHNAVADYGPHQSRLLRRCQVLAA
ncbi:MAG: TauD/TfdA family dioxygenase [Alphaproteobacteria bacterium]|nr:TauD/TfdA family dioxygenase [Alphaproteobacteria bacterium]